MGKVRCGFFKVAAAVPQVKVALCSHNTKEVIVLAKEAKAAGASVVLFPELALTGATCGDLYRQQALLDAAERGLQSILDAQLPIVTVVGLPVKRNGKIFNCAAVVAEGEIYGIVPQQHGNGVFAPFTDADAGSIEICNQTVDFDCNILFTTGSATFGIQIGSDSNQIISPAVDIATSGANIVLHMTAESEYMGSYNTLKSRATALSEAICAGYILCSAGMGESTTDCVYTGSAIAAELGQTISEAPRFANGATVTYADIDTEAIEAARINRNVATDNDLYPILLPTYTSSGDIARTIDPAPFIPKDLDSGCNEVLNLQAAGLAKRLQHTNCKKVVLGISGGLDSTLALIAVVRTFDLLGLDRKGIVGVTMPGFGTTGRTYNNALTLMQELGITLREVSIRAACEQHFKDIDLDPTNRGAAYENSQARERTQILMDIANDIGGLVVGTGDLSESALGWATYNGDHMSMYNVNCSVPKTLVCKVTEWAAKTETNEKVRAALLDIVDTPVSPELLPADKSGNIAQKTEDLVGPYELHDFFIYHFVVNGFTPDKIFAMAKIAFADKFDNQTIKKWLTVFLRRFFSQQFKRSAVPDGPKVTAVSLSPRGSWAMPSDACVEEWLATLNS
ncbi:MAG: NAD(+) synthase [Rikenellaceae bacterium]|nr:NAD(+) synthase [Rikenellaceae bacterium]